MNHLMRAAALTVALAVIAGCQTSQVTTASGRPEVTVTAPPEKVRATILNEAVNRRFTIKTDTVYSLVVEQPSKDFMMGLLLGSNWDPTVNVRVTFTFVPLEAQTRVIAEQVAVTNPGTAMERITPLTGQKAVDGLQAWLDGLQSKVAAAPA